jgi:hypothetical protein
VKLLITALLLAAPPTWVLATRECKSCNMRVLREAIVPQDAKNCGRARGPDAGVELLMTKCFKWAQQLGPVQIRFDGIGEDEVFDYTYLGWPDGGIEVLTESHNDACDAELSRAPCVALPDHPGKAAGCSGGVPEPICSELGTAHWKLSKPKPMKELLTQGVLYLPPDAGSLVCEQHLRGVYCIAAAEWRADGGR